MIETEKVHTPKSHISQELAAAEKEDNIEDQAYLASLVIHDFTTGRSAAYTRDINNKVYTDRLFVAGRDGHNFLQAGVSHTGKDYLEVGEITDQERRIEVEDYGDRKLINVPQCHMLQVAKDSNPYLYLTMSSCSAVVGVTDSDLIVAHVGLSERGGLQKFVEKMKELGVKPENLYAVANLGELSMHDRGVRNSTFDHRHADSFEDYASLRIPKENIRPFQSYSSEKGKTDTCAGVIVTPRYIESYTFDFERNQHAEIYGDVKEMITWEIPESKDLPTEYSGDIPFNIEDVILAGGNVEVQGRHGGVYNVMVDVGDVSEIRVNPVDDKKFYFEAVVLDAEKTNKRQISFNIVTQDGNGYKDPNMRGAELASMALEYFDGIKKIDELAFHWNGERMETDDTTLQVSVNYEQYIVTRDEEYQRLINDGVPHVDAIKNAREIAVFSTWTGKNIAQQYGFNIVNEIHEYLSDEDKGFLYGITGVLSR